MLPMVLNRWTLQCTEKDWRPVWGVNITCRRYRDADHVDVTCRSRPDGELPYALYRNLNGNRMPKSNRTEEEVILRKVAEKFGLSYRETRLIVYSQFIVAKKTMAKEIGRTIILPYIGKFIPSNYAKRKAAESGE